MVEFWLIFAGEAAATNFLIDFSSIFQWKIDVLLIVFFQSSSFCFEPVDLHKTCKFSYRELLFHFWSFQYFSKKMSLKCSQKQRQMQTRKITSRGPFWDVKISKIEHGGVPKSFINRKNDRFWRSIFWMIFWSWKIGEIRCQGLPQKRDKIPTCEQVIETRPATRVTK